MAICDRLRAMAKKTASAVLVSYPLLVVVPYCTIRSLNTEHIGEYHLYQFAGLTEVWPGANGIGTLADYDSDGIPDRKYIHAGGGFHGVITRDLPVTEEDKGLFNNILTRRKA
ncbi:hypothetical protein HYS47_01585 [Candidatus Woesearchaeota archaeon]|nr:hypothetical protein [Candidatus Woesearchaeota archaeon]